MTVISDGAPKADEAVTESSRAKRRAFIFFSIRFASRGICSIGAESRGAALRTGQVYCVTVTPLSGVTETAEGVEVDQAPLEAVAETVAVPTE